MVDDSDPLGPIDLDALDAYLISDDAPENSMGLSDLDGFLTGLVVGPGLILPGEWLPVIWDGKQPQFRSGDDMRTVLGTIMGRYNEIAACFNNDPDVFDPIFWEGPQGDAIVSDWAGGFLDAVALRLDDWKALLDSDDAWKLMVPFLLLNGDVEFEDDAAEEAFLTEAPDMIPVCIRGICEFWRSRKQRPVSLGAVRSRRRNGRGRYS